MPERYRKIDAHSHIGKTYLGPKSAIDIYIQHARIMDIIASVIAPGPTPEATIPNTNSIYYSCIWKASLDKGVEYVQQWIQNGNIVREEPAEKNPYAHANRALFALSHQITKPRIYVMPLHHPILDTESEVKAIINNPNTVALKIHGVATYTGPENIANFTIDELKRVGKPVVVHTDLYSPLETNPFHVALNLNHPTKWIQWSRETGIKTLITHGARLVPEAIELASSSKTVMIGISPDLLLMSEPDSLSAKTDNFLHYLMYIISSKKLLFDIDYGFNVRHRDDWENRDWDMEKRILEASSLCHFDKEDVDNIFYSNALRFFSI